MNEIVAMPIVFSGKYLPEACASLVSRQEFIKTHNPLSRKLPLASSRRGAEFRVCKDTQNRMFFYAVDLEKQDLIYLMHLNPLRFKLLPGVALNLTKMAMYQGSVWRGGRSIQLLGQAFAKTVFWSLFNHKRNLFSDSMQSEQGKSFWERRIDDAFTKGLDVYAVHFKPQGKTQIVDKSILLTPMSDIHKYWAYEEHTDEDGLYWRFAICHP